MSNATSQPFLFDENDGHFQTVDYVIFIALIVVSVAIGFGVGIKEWSTATTTDFLIGGRKMHPIPVAMSLIGGVVSAISVFGNATEMYLYGTQLSLNLLGCLYGTIIVTYLILPTLYPLELISMMQYLELRFDSVLLKKMGSLNQMLNMCLYLGICLYTPSLALSSVTNFSSASSILILGLICTLYISIGGVKAVVYTDVVQTTIMFIGVLSVIIVVCIDLGGFWTVMDIAREGGRLKWFNMDPSPFIRHTFWSVQVLGLYFVVSVVALSQAQFQRLNSVRSLEISQRLCVMFFFGLLALWSLFYFTGIVAYSTYADCDPYESGKIDKPDQIIPYLIADKLRRIPGMAGLFVAAVYGAVLSSVSSQASSISALAWEDFLCDSAIFKKYVRVSAVNATRLITAVAGITGVGLAFLVGSLGTLFQVTYSVLGAVTGPLNGLFIVGIAAPWVNEKGAICGFVSSLVFNVWLVVGQFIYDGGTEPHLPLSTEGCVNVTQNFTQEFITRIPPQFLAGVPYVTLPENNSETYVISVPENTFFERPQDHLQERDYPIIYDISYCYFGTIGIFIVLLVATMVSFFTGPTSPNEINPKMVNASILKVYKKIWRKFNSKNSLKIQYKNGSSDKGSRNEKTNSGDYTKIDVLKNKVSKIEGSKHEDSKNEVLKNGKSIGIYIKKDLT